MYNSVSQPGPSTAGACLGQINPVRGEPEAAYVAKQLDSAITCLEMRIGELRERLIPVIEERATCAEKRCLDGQAQRQVMSPLGRGIMDASYRIDAVENRILDILDTLAL